MEIVFLPVAKGGLGLIDPFDIDLSNSLRRLHETLSPSTSLSYHLLRLSSERHVPPLSSPHELYAQNPWSLLRRRPLRFSHPLWKAIAAAGASLNPPDLHIHLPSLSTSDILSLPPSLFVSHPALDPISLVAELYSRSRSKLSTLPPSYGLLASNAKGLKNARIVWTDFVASHPLLSSKLPSPVVAESLPAPTPPGSPSFQLFGLPRPLSSSAVRSRIVSDRPPSRIDQKLEPLFPAPPSGEALARRTWKWIHAPPATPREADTHWRLLHNGIMTRSRLAHFAQGATSSCVFCPDASDDVVHALFTCGYSKEYWNSLLCHLTGSLSSAFTPFTFSADEVLLGLPTLRLLTDDRNALDLRAIVAVAIQQLVDARWARIKPDPLLSSPTPSDLALKTVYSYIHRLS